MDKFSDLENSNKIHLTLSHKEKHSIPVSTILRKARSIGITIPEVRNILLIKNKELAIKSALENVKIHIQENVENLINTTSGKNGVLIYNITTKEMTVIETCNLSSDIGHIIFTTELPIQPENICLDDELSCPPKMIPIYIINDGELIPLQASIRQHVKNAMKSTEFDYIKDIILDIAMACEGYI